MTPLILYAAAPDSVPVIRCSPPSWAAQIALVEEDVPHDLRWLRFDHAEHRSDAMLRINPAGTLPVLTDGNTVITETTDVLEYIVQRSAHHRLAASAERLAAAGDVKDAGMAAFRALMKGATGEPPWAAFEQRLDHWTGAVEAGVSEFDIAELLVFVYVATAQSLGFSTERWPEVEALTDRVARRRAVAVCWPATWASPLGPAVSQR